jgi:protein SCO1/2
MCCCLPLRLFVSLWAVAICAFPLAAQVQPAKSGVEFDRPLEIPDAELVNQRGEKVHFYSDLVKGRVVVIQSIFTTCTTLCPLLGTAFSHVQDTVGSDVHLISISVDPAADTPERLKAWGARYHAGPNWTMVTGTKPEVDRVLRALKFYTSDKLSHTALVLVGNDATGRWARTSGLVPAARIAEMVKSLMAPVKTGTKYRQTLHNPAEHVAASAF